MENLQIIKTHSFQVNTIESIVNASENLVIYDGLVIKDTENKCFYRVVFGSYLGNRYIEFSDINIDPDFDEYGFLDGTRHGFRFELSQKQFEWLVSYSQENLDLFINYFRNVRMSGINPLMEFIYPETAKRLAEQKQALDTSEIKNRQQGFIIEELRKTLSTLRDSIKNLLRFKKYKRLSSIKVTEKLMFISSGKI
jgi:hypothetical protein